MLYLITKLFFLFVVAITITAESANAEINITQHANNIFNCTSSGIFGNKSCFQELAINNHQENGQLVSSPSDSIKLEQSTEVLQVIKEKSEQPKKEDFQMDELYITAIGSFVVGIGGVTIIGWILKKIFSLQETKELKKRVEILEAIVTKE